MRVGYLVMGLFLLVLLGNVKAYYNITFVNTTVVLNSNTSAHVVETFDVYVSNSSVSQYTKNRNAIGLTLNDWQKTLYATNLVQNIINYKRSTYDFTFLPGPLILEPYGGQAILTMSYYVNNVTDMKNIAPREFEYTFNNSVLNFEYTINGQALPPNYRFNIIIPAGSELVKVYPLPDSPAPSFLGDYKNFTSFSWYSQEPLSQFSFSFTSKESLQSEVTGYFSNIYYHDYNTIYLLLLLGIALAIVYTYIKFWR
jgi:hypothetical protein